MHFDPHYGRSQARHFENWPQRDRVRASELTQAGINNLADAIVLLHKLRVERPLPHKEIVTEFPERLVHDRYS